jgi:hypothetical protein
MIDALSAQALLVCHAPTRSGRSRVPRVTQAMLQMDKFDIATLQRAYLG